MQAWRLYHVEQVISDQLVKDKYPVLSLPLALRLRLDGGVKVSRGNDYFAFAPPRIIVEGQLDGLKVYCNNTSMLPLSVQDGTFELLELAPGLGTKASIELRRDSEVLARRTVYLVHDFVWQTPISEGWTDQFGVCASDSVVTPRIAGPKVSGMGSLVNCFWMPAGLHGEKRVFFVGRLPGEIVNWPAESLPDNWSPVWAVPKRRSGRAVFCGGSIEQSGPMNGRLADSKKVELWKELLWGSRKKIAPPARKSVLALWKRFQEVARSV